MNVIRQGDKYEKDDVIYVITGFMTEGSVHNHDGKSYTNVSECTLVKIRREDEYVSMYVDKAEFLKDYERV